jgi:hypothetical protein
VIIVPTLAPGFLLKSGDEFKGQAKYSETVVGDLKKAVRLTRSLPTWDEAEVWKPGRLFPTPQDVLDFCREAHQEADHAGSAEAGVMLGADVETTGEHPLQCQLICIGLGLKRRDGSVRGSWGTGDGHTGAYPRGPRGAASGSRQSRASGRN